jgi:uncharacterized delta-60 repeat protein
VTARRSAAALAAVTALAFPALLSAARGDLDPTFGSGGKVTTDFGASETGWAVAVQPDKRIVVAGERIAPAPLHDFVLARYTANGRLDPSFDGDGKVATDFGGRQDGAVDVAVRSDGKVVAAGSSRLGGGSVVALARYNRDGSLDSSFGAGGKVLTTFPPSNFAAASAVLLQPDGKILVGGHAGRRFASGFALARFLPNGALDPSFGGGGRVITPIPQRDNDRVFALAVQPDGKLVAVGGSFERESVVVLARYAADGTPDLSFGGDGIAVASFRPIDMVPTRVFVLRNRKLLVAGYGGVTRFGANGSLDRSFGEGGRARPVSVDGYTAALLPDGKILVIGATPSTGRPAGRDFGVARLTADGRLDTTYGRRGSISTGFSPRSDDQALDGVLLRDGKLVVSGISDPTPETGSFGPWDFAVARYVAIRFCVVPNVRGRTLAAARTRFVRANCRVGKLTRVYSRRARRGTVISQRSRAGVRLPELAKVDLVVSRGPRR